MSVVFYSQPATRQDEWVIEQHGERPGYFVEIGAHDGIRHSNTLALERHYGWTGLLVEANPELYQKLFDNRPDAATSSSCIGPVAGRNESFVLGNAYSGIWKYMPNEFKREHNVRRNRLITKRTQSLKGLLDDYKCPRVIDYLSLDVEGAEYEILDGFFAHFGQDHYDFRYITCEFRYDRLLLRQLEQMMDANGYELTDVRAFDACFINNKRFS